MTNLVNDPNHAALKAHLRQELDNWLAKAEDPYLPAELRGLPLPERITRQNQYYTLLIHQEEWDQYVADAVAPYVEGATPEREKQIRRIAKQVFDADFFGHHMALDSELNSRRLSDRPVDEVKQEFAEHEQIYVKRFSAEVEAV